MSGHPFNNIKLDEKQAMIYDLLRVIYASSTDTYSGYVTKENKFFVHFYIDNKDMSFDIIIKFLVDYDIKQFMNYWNNFTNQDVLFLISTDLAIDKSINTIIKDSKKNILWENDYQNFNINDLFFIQELYGDFLIYPQAALKRINEEFKN